MATLLKYRGREVMDADAAFLRDLIERNPEASRRALSRLACQAWNWVQPNGALRDMVCRGLMLALHRSGHIVLPARRHVSPNPLAHRRRPVPVEMQTILANCLAHGRRKFVDVAGSFPDECIHVLEILKDVYRNDAIARNRGMTPEQRLRFHQDQSGPGMADLDAWMEAQIDERKVEPNSGLGGAIAYMRNHWKELTLFLRVPGAPLDNNVCERALKKAILHRKNAYFYKTENGARVGDLFMSLIHTCQLNGANPFHYLTELQKHACELAAAPADWMPWNYLRTLESGQGRPSG